MGEEQKHVAKISIIIPIFNMQSYLSRCLESILAQTYPNYEVVCVDDGSTDESGNICETYRKKDARIKVYHITNGGVSNARNFGLSRMTGEWFAYIDADDWVEADYLKILYENAIKYNCDVSACFFQRDGKHSLIYNSEVETTVFYSSEECIHNFICAGNSMEGMACNKLYRAEKFQDIVFDRNIRVNEDCLYTYEVMKKCQKACLTTSPLYHWVYREDSASRSKDLSGDLGAANVFLDLYQKTIDLKDFEISQTLKKNYVCAVIKVLTYVNRTGKNSAIQEAKERCIQWSKNVWKLLDNRTRLKYILTIYMPWILHFVRR